MKTNRIDKIIKSVSECDYKFPLAIFVFLGSLALISLTWGIVDLLRAFKG